MNNHRKKRQLEKEESKGYDKREVTATKNETMPKEARKMTK